MYGRQDMARYSVPFDMSIKKPTELTSSKKWNLAAACNCYGGAAPKSLEAAESTVSNDLDVLRQRISPVGFPV